MQRAQRSSLKRRNVEEWNGVLQNALKVSRTHKEVVLKHACRLSDALYSMMNERSNVLEEIGAVPDYRFVPLASVEGQTNVELSIWDNEGRTVHTTRTLKSLSSNTRIGSMSLPMTAVVFGRQNHPELWHTVRCASPEVQTVIQSLADGFSGNHSTSFTRLPSPLDIRIPLSSRTGSANTSSGVNHLVVCTQNFTMSTTRDVTLLVRHTGVSHNTCVHSKRFIAETLEITNEETGAKTHITLSSQVANRFTSSTAFVFGFKRGVVGVSSTRPRNSELASLPLEGAAIAQTAAALRSLAGEAQRTSTTSPVNMAYESMRTDPYLRKSVLQVVTASPNMSVVQLAVNKFAPGAEQTAACVVVVNSAAEPGKAGLSATESIDTGVKVEGKVEGKAEVKAKPAKAEPSTAEKPARPEKSPERKPRTKSIPVPDNVDDLFGATTGYNTWGLADGMSSFLDMSVGF